MFGKEIFPLMSLVYFCLALIIGIVGCGEGDDGGSDSEWVGTWRLESVDGRNYEAFWDALGFSIVTNSWTFHDDGTWEAELLLEGEEAVKSMGTYSLSGSDYTATGLSEALEDTEADSGTWSRQGNTLTITSDGGIVIGLKKK